MWPWKHNTSNRELLERVESLERRFKTLLADVDEYFHLVRRAENRMAKKAAAQPEETEATNGTANSQPQPFFEGGPLTPRQKEIQQAILRRRAGM
jgi:hypothetical protein